MARSAELARAGVRPAAIGREATREALPAGRGQRQEGEPLSVESLQVTVHGMQLRLLSAGHGWPLLLLHGLGGGADEWLEVLPRLAARFRAIAIDAPGHGLSEKPRTFAYDVPSYARTLLGVMDALGIRRAPLVAVSGGGVVALTVALTHPERVSKLVLVDAAGLGREVAWSYRLATLPLAGYALRRIGRRGIERLGRRLCRLPERLPDGWVERRLRLWREPGAVEAFVATARAGISLRGQRVHYASRLREIQHPTLLVWGRNDPIIPVAHALAAAKALPNARLHIFEDCGHVPLWEYPEAFTRVVLEFLLG